MRALKIITFATVFVFLVSERVIAQTTDQNRARVVRGELIYVLCGESIRIRDESLNEIKTAEPFERISPYQGWGNIEKTLNVGGRSLKFVKVELLRDEESSGWVAEQYVKLKSDCPRAEVTQARLQNDDLQNISGLNDTRCCLFPIESQPTLSYTTGERSFGARRSKGRRVHAGTDLYTGLHRNIRAVASGVVLYSPRKFYMGTNEFAVRHPGGFIVRYSEIAPKKNVRGIEANVRVRTGQVIAYVGQLVPRIRPPMLHLEIYKGTASGSLSTLGAGRGRMYRRSDVINPTRYVQRWEQLTF